MTYGPDVVGGQRHDPAQVARRAYSRAGNHAPARTIPMLDQRRIRAIGVSIVADRPDISGCASEHRAKDIVTAAGVAAGYNCPLATIPVFDQGNSWAAARAAHRPDVVRCEGTYAYQLAGAAAIDAGRKRSEERRVGKECRSR